MNLFLAVITCLSLANCSRDPNETRSKRPDTLTVSTDGFQLRSDSLDKPEPGNRLGAQAGRWTYEKTGSAVYKASVSSANLVPFAYPYTGGSTATLTLREKDGSAQVYIEVSNGQFNRSFQNGVARIRFDGKSPVTYSLLAAANGRANIIFFDAERQLIRQIKASKNISVDVRFDGQPARRIEFRTADLNWSR